jgi:geranylgeranyl pyrophosphate synthase
LASNGLTTINFLSSVQEHIDKVEELMQAQAQGHHSELGAALGHLLSSGGKRVRPAVTLLTGCMLGAKMEHLITLSAAIELLHTATLVHDDLIDGSLLRRGIPTLNANWSPAATVLTGDFIFARAAVLASQTKSVEVIEMFSETLATIVNGEIIQLFASKGLASREDYYSRIHAKTASMFELATSAAAILSPQGAAAVNCVSEYGYGIGMAFQIIDDVLDFTGEQVHLGKPVASDLRQGLITLPTLCYLENHPDDPDLKAILNGNRNDGKHLDRLAQSVRESGAIHQAMDEARQFVNKGLSALRQLPPNQERHALEELADYVVQRHR